MAIYFIGDMHLLFSVRALFKKLNNLLPQALLRYEQPRMFTTYNFASCSMRQTEVL